MIKKPDSVASLFGWGSGAFLVGIVLHSLFPYFVLPRTWVAVGAASLVALFVFTARVSWTRVAALCLLALLVGVWRFDARRPAMPKNLQPFSPKHLAYEPNQASLGSMDDPRYWLARGKSALTERAKKLFPPDQAVLLAGVLYGERGLSPAVKEQFRKAGLLHIIAVSGTNMTIIAVLLMRSLLAIGLRRRTAFAVFTIGLLAYVFFVSPSPSVARAAIMGWLVEFAPIVGRIPRPSRLLLLAAAVFSFLKPWALMYDASFALSFLAMWGLLTWGARLQEWTTARGFSKFWSEIFSASAGATLMTAPYTAWAFGQASVWGLLSSLVVLPLIPWVMALGALALVVPFPYIFVLPTRGFLDAILWVAAAINRIPFGSWSGLVIPFWFFAVCYSVLWFVWREYGENKRVIHRFAGVLSTPK